MAGICVATVMLVGCGGATVAEVAGPDGEGAGLTPRPAITPALATPRAPSIPPASAPTQEARQSSATPRPEPAAAVPPASIDGQDSAYDIVALIPRDAIPAILQPEFLDAERAGESYDDYEQVLGLSIDGDNRAYPVPFLSRHEIVNDTVGGMPVAVTW